MGTYVTDANETDLLTGADLATDGTDRGDVVQVDWPQEVTFILTTGTVTGVNFIHIEGCETSDFSTADVVTFGGFNLVAGDDDDTKEFTTRITSKYVRAFVTIGTGGDLSASTLYMRQPHWMRTRLNSTTDLL
jgi:hypothetical protein